jgi:ABC-type nitrate/sulfonate/bicarbonate transport system ATPase subunit
MEALNTIVIKKLTKKFGNRTVISNFSFDFNDNKIYSIIAPSGAGKTTLLRIISGLEKDYLGSVDFSFKSVDSNIGFIFQEASIFPWLTVKENLLFGLKLDRNIRSEAHELLEDIAKDVGLLDYLDHYPKQLSGGQKQRVAFGRSLVLHPPVLLCDEPFSSLDDTIRQEMRELLLKIQCKYRLTILFVTHSVEEALFLGDYTLKFTSSPLSNVVQEEISFDTKRDKELLYSAQFNRIKQKIISNEN